MPIVNLGNVVGLIKSPTPPAKTYVLWAKQLDPLGNPNSVELRYHNGTSWELLGSGGMSSDYIAENKDVEIVMNVVGLPDYTIPIYQSIALPHVGLFTKVLSEGVSVDFGSGPITCDIEVTLFQGYINTTILGKDYEERELVSYRLFKVFDTGNIVLYNSRFQAGSDNIQYAFSKLSGTAEHKQRIESVTVDSFDTYISALTIDDTGNITDLTPPTSTAITHWYQKTISVNNFGVNLMSLSATDLIVRVTSYFNGIDPTTNDLSSDFGVTIDGIGVGFSITKVGITEYDITIPFANLISIGKETGNRSLKIFGNGTFPLESKCVVEGDGFEYKKFWYMDDCRVWMDNEYPLHTQATPCECIAPATMSDGRRADLKFFISEETSAASPIKVYASYEHQMYLNPFPDPIYYGKKPNEAFQKTYFVKCDAPSGEIYNKIIAFYEIQGATI